MTEKVCIVAGAGPGTGLACARRFAEGGFKVAMLARNAERVAGFADEIPNATAYPLDVTDGDAVAETIARIEAELGPPEVLVENAVRATFGAFDEVDPDKVVQAFRVNYLGLLFLARAVAPGMVARGQGAIIVTGNTAARRGKADYAGFAPTKAAQRILAETIARKLGPEGVHVAYLMIDAVIDSAWTRGRWPDRPDDFYCQPADIAEVAWQTAHQPKSAWAFDVEIRPFGETW